MSDLHHITREVVRRAGGPTALGKALGIPAQNVCAWQRRGRIPAQWCVRIQAATAGAVQAHQIRPDVFPQTEQAAA